MNVAADENAMKLKKKLLKGYKRGMKTLMSYLFGCDVHKESRQNGA